MKEEIKVIPSKLRPKDKVAMLAIVAFTVLKLYSINSHVDVLFALVIGYYFAHRKDGTDKGY